MRLSDEVFLRSVAREVRDSLHVRDEWLDRHVFLCGANPKVKSGSRNRLGRSLETKERHWWLPRYVIHYPETLFDGLMSGPNRYDLLTLENILAEAVDAVVLIVESAGAIAELGAFVNHLGLQQKLVVVQDEEYRRAKSFIGHGPIRFLQDQGLGSVLFLPLNEVEEHVDKIKEAINEVAKANPVPFNLSNIFHAPSLVIPCLFLLERLTREEMAILVAEAADLQGSRLEVVVSAAISVLVAERVIAMEQGGFCLTESGARDVVRKGWWLDRAVYSEELLNRIRVDVLTRQRRRYRPWADSR